jgi:Co/Zn/Cd efflux system component
LLWRFRELNINMKSTFECSRKDVAANVGLLVAAGGVALTGSGWPDIAAGAVIALLFLKSALEVIGEASPALRAAAK